MKKYLKVQGKSKFFNFLRSNVMLYIIFGPIFSISYNSKMYNHRWLQKCENISI